MGSRTAFLIALTIFPVAVLNASEIPPALSEAMRARLDAVWTKDAETWSRLTADEFKVVVPDGGLQTKTERLAALKTEVPQTKRMPEREEIKVYGNAATRRLLDGDEWVLEVWVQQDGVWRVVAAHVSLIGH